MLRLCGPVSLFPLPCEESEEGEGVGRTYHSKRADPSFDVMPGPSSS